MSAELIAGLGFVYIIGAVAYAVSVSDAHYTKTRLICVALLVMGLWGLIEVAMTGERTSPKRR